VVFAAQNRVSSAFLLRLGHPDQIVAVIEPLLDVLRAKSDYNIYLLNSDFPAGINDV
jgi:hypothetical protein